MFSVITALLLVAALAVAVFGGLHLLRKRAAAAPQSALNSLFKPRPEPRLKVVEQSYIDGKRKLVLIRRDDVEHLILTGGPVDVVIETGIGAERSNPHTP